LGYFFAAAGAILFSMKAVFVKLAFGLKVDAETLLALRMALALPVYVAVGAYDLTLRAHAGIAFPGRRPVAAAILIGLLGYWFASYTDFLGLKYVTAQFERLILFTYPLFVVLFGALFFRQPIRARTLIAFGISYAGLTLLFAENVSAQGSDAAVGAAFVFAGASAFALYQLLAKETIALMGPRLFTCIAMTGASCGAFAQFALVRPVGALSVGAPVLGYAFALAIAATVLPTFFLSAALHRISAQANATIGILSPVATIILAALVLGERLNGAGMAGAALVLIGVGWYTLVERD
jgi:drug/metabolite transporter (DMT)-like permease